MYKYGKRKMKNTSVRVLAKRCARRTDVMGSNPDLWTHLQVRGSKRLGCHADLCTVSRCHTRVESEGLESEKTGTGSTLALKPRANIARSQKQWPHEKDLCPPNFLFKKQYSCAIIQLSFD